MAFRKLSRIRGLYQKQRLLRHPGIAGSLKLTILGFGRGGGWLLRQEKLRRKIPKQLSRTSSTKSIRPKYE